MMAHTPEPTPGPGPTPDPGPQPPPDPSHRPDDPEVTIVDLPPDSPTRGLPVDNPERRERPV